VRPGWGLCFLLLGLPQAPGHPHLPFELCLHPYTPVSRTLGIVSNRNYGILGCLKLPTSLCSYHTGSLAFGSLILTLVQIARIILEYIDHKLRGELEAGSPAFSLGSLGRDNQRPVTQAWASLVPRSPKLCGPLHHVLLQVLPLVSGKVHQVPEPQRIYHGEHRGRALQPNPVQTAGDSDLPAPLRSPSMGRISVSQPKMPSCCS
jgi:hypothetical protein